MMDNQTENSESLKSEGADAPETKVEQTTAQKAGAPAVPMIDKGRFSIDDTGQVLWQKDSTNPTPGKVVASLAKGDEITSPNIVIVDSEIYPDASTLEGDIKSWLSSHINENLGSIVNFAEATALPEGLQDIARTLKSHLGVVDRYKLNKSLSSLDPDQRKILRQHKIRSGPLMIFYQEHLKPAPLRLKSILWGIYNERELPIKRPKDGIVSEVLDDERIDYPYYKMLGYPVYAGRAIRIDMLDRVVTDIYDQAKEGSFRAQHKYAEWLGCSVDALYAVLEALGHFKVEEPAVAAKTEETKEEDSISEETVVAAPLQMQTTEAVEETASVAASQPTEISETDTQTEEKPAVSPEKPQLAEFKLKKGKLSTPPQKTGGQKIGGKSFAGKHKGKDAEGQSEGKKDFKSKPKGKKAKGPKKPQGPRVIKIESKNKNDDDNPFAILKNLNLK